MALAILMCTKNWKLALVVAVLLLANNGQLALAQLVGATEPGISLAQGGRALQPIIVSDKASESTKASAAELATYLKRITGAEFEVKTGDGSAGIVLGSLAEFPNRGLNRWLEIRNVHDGKEAYAIRTEAQQLLLIGATDKGVPHAVFRFLESIGYRHFFPAPEWEVVPTIPNLRIDLNENDRPSILARRIWFGYGFFNDVGVASQKNPARLDYAAWSRHNRMASSFTVQAGHAWQSIIANNKVVFEAHPEYLALVKDKEGKMVRRGPQLCVSNAGLRQVAIDFALNHFKKNPDADMVSVDPADGDGQCQCDKCKELGKEGNQAFFLANEVARAVAKDFPGKQVGLYAYNWHSEPPDFPLEPNVYVQLTAGFIRGQYTFDELFELWPQKAANMGFYDYYSVWLWDFDRLPGGRAANISYLKKRIPEYVAHKATSLDAESGNNWGPHGRGYYIANKLMWNHKADVDALLADFYEKAFGPGAAAMRRYYERLDPGNLPIMSRHLMALAFRDVQEASTLAKDRPDVLARLAQIKQYLRYVHLRWQIDREKDKAVKKSLTLATFTHAYRTRYSYMNHWEAIRQGWTNVAAKEFEEPTWAYNEKTPKPWLQAAPYTPEETEKAFQEGLVYFQPQPVTEKTFTTDVVPVTFAGSAAIASSQSYQGALRYALYSVNGEPLTVEIGTGVIAWYRDRAPATYTLLSAKEEKLATDRLPLDGLPHKLELKVPGPGLYYFDFNDSGAGWRIAATPDRTISIPLQRERGFSHLGRMQQMYFYVPKGTKQIEYFWAGGAHKVMGPDNKVVQDVTTNGDFVIVPVAAGMDGKVWSFSQFALGRLWFFNIPNYLAPSPNALLVPREVVVVDGLVVRK